MDVRFYNSDFSLLYIESLFKSVDWDILFNNVGTFEMYVSPDSPLVEIALENKLLFVKQGDRQAIITTKHLEDDRFILYGRTLNFLLSKKIVLPFEGTKDITELIELYFPKARIVCNFTLEESSLSLSVPQTLLKCIINILEGKGLGHKLYYDFKSNEWIFEILKGEDKGLLLCESCLNLHSFERDESILDMAKGGYYYQNVTYMGEWDAYANVPYIPISPDNYAKCYLATNYGTAWGLNISKGNYIVCKDINGAFEVSEEKPTGFYKYIGEKDLSLGSFECFVNADNYNEAESKILEKSKTSTVNAKVKNVSFGTDYNLGDIVRISKKAGGKTINEKMKITGVNLWQENSSSGEMPLFSEYKEEK